MLEMALVSCLARMYATAIYGDQHGIGRGHWYSPCSQIEMYCETIWSLVGSSPDRGQKCLHAMGRRTRFGVNEHWTRDLSQGSGA